MATSTSDTHDDDQPHRGTIREVQCTLEFLSPNAEACSVMMTNATIALEIVMRDLMETRAQAEAERTAAVVARREVENMANQNHILREALPRRVMNNEALDKAGQQETPILTISGVPTPGVFLTIDPGTGLVGTFVPPTVETSGSLTHY
ncbi:uncharacterized protein LOC121049071 [Rosa chinensis]|uniref:uncharacterized protein LOC121049071 n=1 Tax=Rosa chinensis TaxID=74649 RepID=UPI001AD8B99B|nr:uncharacterized protein LOC121049071 [Rosa chinensis]